VKGEVVKVVPEDEMVDALVDWATFIGENGVDAALERARSTSDAARRAAERDRAELLDEKGDDANRSEQRVEVIRKL
jgi:(E)-4-hydroxy-3-methylbut-2-enyl-diphosphate synthase